MPAPEKKELKKTKLASLLGPFSEGKIKRITNARNLNQDNKTSTWLEWFMAGKNPVILEVAPGAVNMFSQTNQQLTEEFVEVTDDMIA